MFRRPEEPVPHSPERILDLEPVLAETLENGLRVRILEERTAPTVSLYTFFRVGSRDERPGITGISHLFEHMMFNGAAKYGPKEFDRVLESRGGHSNAYTSNDVTAYYEEFAAEALPTVVDLESDRMRSLAISSEVLEQERAVVQEERRLRSENSIFGLMEEQLEGLVFQAHPYRWPVIGWMEDIQRISREDCQAWFRVYYAPGNAALYLVGDVDPREALDLVRRAYGDIPAGPPVPVVPGAEPPQRGERRAVVRYPAQAAALLAGWRAPAARDRDAHVLDVLQAALSMGESSRLRRRLVEETEIAVSVHVSYGWRRDPGVFMVFVELAPGVGPDRAEKALLAELEKVAEEGISRAELRRAQRLLRSAVLHELATHGGVAHAMGQAEALIGDFREAGTALEHYARVAQRDVRRVAAEWLDAARRNVVVLEPEAARRAR
jgi:predicted Zn-dependent peptidase